VTTVRAAGRRSEPARRVPELRPGVAEWLRLEQSLNERDLCDRRGAPVAAPVPRLSARFRPEHRGWWGPQVAWLPRDATRSYGRPAEALARELGVETPSGRAPLLLHPRPPRELRAVRDRLGAAPLPGVLATPTSSLRSVLAVGTGDRAAVLKLSLGARLSGVRRALREPELASAVVVSRLLDEIAPARRRQVLLDWFSEPAGAIETGSGSGWLLRLLPRSMDGSRGRVLAPAFSLTAREGEHGSLLERMARRAGVAPEELVIEQVLEPYVRVLSFLLFEEGLQVEAHPQNVLFELDRDERLTGRLVLRDLSDVTVSVALRIARGRPLPVEVLGLASSAPPFPLATVAADHRAPGVGAPHQRCRATVESYGQVGFLGALHRSLARSFPRYRPERVDEAYLALWERAAVASLGLRPGRRRDSPGLAVDETVRAFLQRTDWRALAGEDGVGAPPGAEPLRLARGARRGGVERRRVDSPWGSLYVQDGLPAFFAPAANRRG
jgi:hypothetical protein